MYVAVLGAGTMGHGIAQVSAMAGHDVVLRDIDEDIVEDGLAAIESNLEAGIERDKVTEPDAEATLDRLTGTTSLEDAVSGADLVVEAVPEDIDIKHETFTEVESHVDRDALIASNTSSLSLTEIVRVLEYPERAIGLHFFNPVHIMALVEIVVPEQASDETVSRTHEFVADIDKTPVEVTDSPGFARPVWASHSASRPYGWHRKAWPHQKTSTRRWNWDTTIRWGRWNSPTWWDWTSDSTSSSISARS